MEFLKFSLWFTLIHTLSYLLAGALALGISGNLYKGDNRLLDFLRDMANEKESRHVQKYFIPAQLIRGLLMAVVLFPLVDTLADWSFGGRFIFLFGLLVIFTDFASAVPFPNNIEGWVYMKKDYIKKQSFWKLYFETAIYGFLLALSVSWLLF